MTKELRSLDGSKDSPEEDLRKNASATILADSSEILNTKLEEWSVPLYLSYFLVQHGVKKFWGPHSKSNSTSKSEERRIGCVSESVHISFRKLKF